MSGITFGTGINTNGSYLSSAVAWFRGEGLGRQEQTVRAIAAIAIAVFLSLSLVGICFVVRAAAEWKRQEEFPNKVAAYAASLMQDTPPSPKPEPVVEQKRTEVPKVEALPVQPMPIKKPEASFYPQPFETLHERGISMNDEAIGKVDKALKRKLPGAYATLEEEIPSKEQLEGLLKEAKMLAHHYSMRDFGEGVNPPNDQYKMILVPNLDHILRHLAKEKSFPPASVFKP